MAQITGFLATNQFQMTFQRMPSVTYFLQSPAIPGLGFANPAIEATPRRQIPLPGDMVDYELLTIEFKVAKDLSDWFEVHDWIRGIGTPESISERKSYEDSIAKIDSKPFPRTAEPTPGSIIVAPNITSTAALLVLDPDYQEIAKITFYDIHPVWLDGIRFSTTESSIRYATAVAYFAYSIYDIKRTPAP